MGSSDGEDSSIEDNRPLSIDGAPNIRFTHPEDVTLVKRRQGEEPTIGKIQHNLQAYSRIGSLHNQHKLAMMRVRYSDMVTPFQLAWEGGGVQRRPLPNLENAYFTLVFCRGRRRNQPDCSLHVQCHCFVL